MNTTSLKVELLSHTPNPDSLIALAAKLCYSPTTIDELKEKLTDEEVSKFIKKLMDLSHESPLEHASFTFAVEGVSRSLTHQLVRHRIASYSQKSQRYVKEGNFEYIVPPEIMNDMALAQQYICLMKEIQNMYDYMVEKLIANGRDKKQAIEDARYILPNACETKIIFTMNARTLLNFFAHRRCTRAQWEIRELANKMVVEVRKVAPLLFSKAGASCIQLGYCPEGSMSCGLFPTLEQIKKGEVII